LRDGVIRPITMHKCDWRDSQMCTITLISDRRQYYPDGPEAYDAVMRKCGGVLMFKRPYKSEESEFGNVLFKDITLRALARKITLITIQGDEFMEAVMDTK